MPNTAKGLPYPDGDTLLSEIDLAIKALAEAVDALTVIRRMGTVTTAVHVVGTVLTTTVTFATPFPVGTVPLVFLAVQNSSAPQNYDYEPRNVTNTGFQISSVRSSGTAALQIAYLAIAP